MFMRACVRAYVHTRDAALSCSHARLRAHTQAGNMESNSEGGGVKRDAVGNAIQQGSHVKDVKRKDRVGVVESLSVPADPDKNRGCVDRGEDAKAEGILSAKCTCYH